MEHPSQQGSPNWGARDQILRSHKQPAFSDALKLENEASVVTLITLRGLDMIVRHRPFRCGVAAYQHQSSSFVTLVTRNLWWDRSSWVIHLWRRVKMLRCHVLLWWPVNFRNSSLVVLFRCSKSWQRVDKEFTNTAGILTLTIVNQWWFLETEFESWDYRHLVQFMGGDPSWPKQA